MKKSILAILGLATLASADWLSNPVNITTVRVARYDGAVIFKTDGGFPANRTWHLKAQSGPNSAQFKFLVDALLTAKATGTRIQLLECGQANVTPPNDEWFVCDIIIQ